jgi:hypothetical protein
MTRRILFELMLFVLPFVAFWVWRWARGRAGAPLPSWPWIKLVAAGLVIVTISITVQSLTQPRHVNERWVPAQVGPDGQLIPGRFEPVDPTTPALPPPPRPPSDPGALPETPQ